MRNNSFNVPQASIDLAATIDTITTNNIERLYVLDYKAMDMIGFVYLVAVSGP